MQISSSNSWLFKNHFLKGRKNLKNLKKNKFEIFFIFFCENSKLLQPRFFRDFYFHGTMNVPCTRQQESIRNWRTFCGLYSLQVTTGCVKTMKSSVLYQGQNCCCPTTKITNYVKAVSRRFKVLKDQTSVNNYGITKK